MTAADIHVRARRFVIATGARSVAPGIPGLDTVPYFTGETIFDNTRKLTHLVVIGAGPMGLELAQAYNRLGTQVTVVEEGAPLAASDPELAGIALQRMREEGVEIRAGSTVTAILGRSQGIGVVVRSGESDDMLDVSHILVATGRVPDLEALDLDKAGIRRSKDDPRRLALTAGLRTSNRRVYAVGDAAGGARQVHLAGHEAELVVRSILVGLPVRHDHSLIPSVTYTDPEIAEVGLTEPELRRRRGADFRIVRWSFADSDRARATRQSYGIAKMITDRTGRILGAGIVGPGAGELIAIFSFAIANRLSVRHLVNFATPHRTLSDIVRRLGAEYFRDRSANPLLQRLIALIRLLP